MKTAEWAPERLSNHLESLAADDPHHNLLKTLLGASDLKRFWEHVQFHNKDADSNIPGDGAIGQFYADMVFSGICQIVSELQNQQPTVNENQEWAEAWRKVEKTGRAFLNAWRKITECEKPFGVFPGSAFHDTMMKVEGLQPDDRNPQPDLTTDVVQSSVELAARMAKQFDQIPSSLKGKGNAAKADSEVIFTARKLNNLFGFVFGSMPRYRGYHIDIATLTDVVFMVGLGKKNYPATDPKQVKNLLRPPRKRPSK